jgi:hypothetical protein
MMCAREISAAMRRGRELMEIQIGRDEVQARVRAALCVLILRDAKLLELNAGERSIAARLSAYMQRLFPAYDVDAEYNRHVSPPSGCRTEINVRKIITH